MFNTTVDAEQSWIFEKSKLGEEFFYIRSKNEREGGRKYLGAPNKNNIVFLYTSKNIFTLWRVQKTSDNIYTVIYAGEKFDAKKHTIVVARYNEDVVWLLPYDDCVVLYNKGKDDLPPFTNIVKLANIGREGHTYLHHIIENYNNISDRVTFIQGDPLTHNHTIIYGLDNYIYFNSFQPLGLRWLESEQIPPDPIIMANQVETEYGLNYLVLELNSDLNYRGKFSFYDKGIDYLVKNYRKDYNLPKGKGIAENFLSRARFPMSYMSKPTDVIKFTFSALFSTVRTNIIMYGKEDYRNISKELLSKHDQGGANGYVLERLWMFLFDNI